MQIIGHGARLVRIAFVVAAIGAALLSARLAQTTGSPEAAQAAIASALVAGILLLARRSVVSLVRALARRITASMVRQGAVSAAVSGTCAALAGYIAAGVLLAGGPAADGWAALLLANRIAVATVIVSVAAQCVLVAAGAGRVRERTAALLLLTAATAVPVLALIVLGDALATEDALVMAMRAVGRELLILPALFAATAALLPMVRHARSASPALATA